MTVPVLKLSQISASGANFTSGDFLVAVQSGTTDVLFTPAQVFAFANLTVSGSDVTFGGAVNTTGVLTIGNADTILTRDASYIIAQRNSTNAQTLRVYNTFTDSSNYERGVFDWGTTSNVLSIGTQNLGTGSARDTRLISSGNIALGSDLNHYIKFTNDVFLQVYFQHSGGPNYSAIITGDDTGSSGNFRMRLGSGGYFIWCNDAYAQNGSVDLGLSRSAAGVFALDGSTKGDGQACILAKTKAGAFTTSDIPAGTWILGRDTSGATTKLIYNDAGTLMTVALT